MEDYRDNEKDKKIFKKLMSMPTDSKRQCNIFWDILKSTNFVDNNLYFIIINHIMNNIHNFEGSDIIKFFIFKLTDEQNQILLYELMYDSYYIKIFIQNGIDINCQDKNGITMLNKAVKSNLIQIVEFLLENGANQLITDKYDRLPLHRIMSSSSDEYTCDIFFMLVENLLANKNDHQLTNDEYLTKIFSSRKNKDGFYTVSDMIFSNIVTDSDKIIDFILSFDPELKIIENINFLNRDYNLKWIKDYYKKYEEDDKINYILTYMSKENRIKYIFTNLLMEAISHHKSNMYEYLENKGADINLSLYYGRDYNNFATILFSCSPDIIDRYINRIDEFPLIMSLFNFICHDSYNETMNCVSKEQNFYYILKIVKQLGISKIDHILYKIKDYSEYYKKICQYLSYFLMNTHGDEFFENIVPLLSTYFINKNFEEYFYINNLKANNFKLLLEHGLNPNLKIKGIPLSLFLCNEKHCESIYLFLEYGVDLYVDPEVVNLEYSRNVINTLNHFSLISPDTLPKMNRLYNYIVDNNCNIPRNARVDYEDYLCDPITLELFIDPLIASDGKTYSRSTLTDIFRRNPISPTSRERLILINGEIGIRNYSMIALIDKFVSGKLFITK